MQITKTEIQGIEASTLLTHFQTLETHLSDLLQAVKPQPDTQLLTRQEVAKWLDVSLPTLHAWTKNGILQSYRIGNKIRYKKNEVLNALQSINPQ
ncbi:helix-turn-helix domain-containing protein [Maribacter ulvicola]|nr:helix-turn-helix domain-containing protein [Maribacter ulvicola]